MGSIFGKTVQKIRELSNKHDDVPFHNVTEVSSDTLEELQEKDYSKMYGTTDSNK
jgi:hypothetical protein